MTRRAVLIGLLGAAWVCGVTYFNDAVMHQTYFVGNTLPISVYGLLILLLLLVHPLAVRFWPRLTLSGAEWAVILALTLSVCCIPGSNLMRYFTSALVMPHHYVRTTPSWEKHKVLEQVPKGMLVEVTPDNESTVLGGFVQGLSSGVKDIAWTQVPWSAWVRPILFWTPVILLLWVGVLGLTLVLHPQWAHHEQLPYPIATFASSLLPGLKEKTTELLRNRLFYIGFGLLVLYHLNNYACQWFPQNLSMAPTNLNLTSLRPLFPIFDQGGGWWVLTPRLTFTVIAFAYFLASDVSLALGIGPLLWVLVAGTLAGYGISAGGGNPSINNFVQFGGYLGMLLVLLYTGRQYYGEVWRGIWGRLTAVPGYAIWGGRVFLLAMAGVVAYLSVRGGISWQIAVLYVGMMVLIFVVMSRIVAETGAFFVQAYFSPNNILLGLLGASALGPQALLITGLFTTFFLIDPREALMPYISNGLRLLDMQKVPLGQASRWIVVALIVGFTVALPVTLYYQYDKGANMRDKWANEIVVGAPFNGLVGVKDRLAAQGRLEMAESVQGWGHFATATPDPKMLLALAFGVGLVLLCSVGRLRIPRWPLHPVAFLIWGTYPGYCFAGSFFIGWIFKSLVTKYGGGTLYRSLKPLMIGIIAGELCSGMLIMLHCFIYYLLYMNQLVPEPPKSYSIFPG
jgi:hypothetical protein